MRPQWKWAILSIFAMMPASRGWAEQRVVADPAALSKLTLPAAARGPAAGKMDARLEPVTAFFGPMPAGVAIARDGRIFVTFPRWSDDVQFTAAEVSKDGKLIPFPNLEAHQSKPNANAGENADRIVSAQGIDIDGKNRLWLLDAGNAKLRAYDLASGAVAVRVQLAPEVLKSSTYANDVRIDLQRGKEGFAYLSDSSSGGVIVVDLASGESWRRLTHAPAARSDDQFIGQVEGEALRSRSDKGDGPPLRGHTDGIALSPDGKTLYFHAFSRRELHAVSTDALADRSMSDAQVESAIRKIASKSSASDGIQCDAMGRVFTTDYEDNAIRRWDPVAGPEQKPETIVHDARILWPDAIWIAGGWMYFTTNQLNRMPSLHAGKDLRQQPYVLYRYPVELAPAAR